MLRVVTASAFVVGALAAPSLASTASPVGDAWAVQGPGVTASSDGTSGSPSFDYRTSSSGTWVFGRTATTSGTVSLPWAWTGSHGAGQNTRYLGVGVLDGSRLVHAQVLVNDTTSSAEPFTYAGTATFTVTAGQRYGFVLGGTRRSSESPPMIEGRFVLPGPPTLSLPTETVTASATDDDGAVVAFDAVGEDEVDGVLTPDCRPASGSLFPIGLTEVTCSVTSSTGQSAEGSFEVRVYPGQVNVVWPKAELMGAGDQRRGSLRELDQALWYRIPVTPDTVLEIELTDLPSDYDLTVFGDIGAAFDELLTPGDLDRLGAEFAADAYSPSAFSPSAFSPSAFSPSAFSPSAFSPSAFSPSAFSPSAFSPSAFSPSAFSPSAFSPSAFSPSAFSPAVSLPSAFSPSAFSPSAFSESELADAFSSAQTRTLIGVSARNGLADEHVRVNTWGATGHFYVRVQGRNGSFAPGKRFTLSTRTSGGPCAAPLSDHAAAPTLRGTPGSARTVVLTDSSRLEDAPLAELEAFAARPEVGGVVVDAADIERVVALQDQADALTACAHAKNLVAAELRAVVNSFRDGAGTLRYVVIAGGDDVVPFVRSSDGAGLGPESGFVPPVADDTSSQAALRRNQVLSQDAYGAAYDLTLKGARVPVADVAVGRLVETSGQIRGALARYAALPGGVLPSRSGLVTGYDFLTDAADAVADSLRSGLGVEVDALVTDRDVAPDVVTDGTPDRRHSWTADDLRDALRGRHDVVLLAGHFSANNALAADHRTALLASELLDPAYDLADSLVLSVGCHSGYGVVDAHAVPFLTDPLDWPEVMARKGAVFIGGTGYQYGDTDLLEYSERLYLGITEQLRTGTGPVAVGDALLRAKQDYLASTPVLGGIDQKSVAEATLYGLPMAAVDLPGTRLPAAPPSKVVPTEVAAGPGSVLGLRALDVVADGASTLRTQAFEDLDDTGSDRFTYLEGPDGVTTQPGQPALPLETLDVGAAGVSLRGVGFRGGTYDDVAGIVPLTGAPTTDVSEVHTAFSSPVFFPRRLALPNHHGALAGDQGTRLLVTAAQHRTEPGGTTSTLRRYSSLDLRLLYSGNVTTYAGNTPALAAPPAVSQVSSEVTSAPDGDVVRITARVVGDPSAGVQEVWVTRTAEQGPWYGAWESVDLVQDGEDSTAWSGTLRLPAGQAAEDVRFVVQAANGVGLVTLEDNQGREFVPGVDPVSLGAGTGAVSLALEAPASAVLGGRLPVTAVLTSGGTPVPGRAVRFSLGTTTATARTGDDGVASASLPLAEQPGDQQVSASFEGDDALQPTTARRSVSVAKRPTSLTLSGPAATVISGTDTGVVAILTAGSAPLADRSVLMVVRDGSGDVVAAASRRTLPDGTATLGSLTLPGGDLTVTGHFGRPGVEVGPGTTAGSTDPENAGSSSEPLPLQVVVPGPPAVVEAVGGGGQSTPVGEEFPEPLEVRVTDDAGVPVPGAEVVFTSPATGAGTDPRTSTVTTDQRGRASLVVRAGTVVGPYDVVAQALGGTPDATTASFALVNAYRLSRFSAPFDAEDGGRVEVPASTTTPFSVQVADVAGPLGTVPSLTMAVQCRVRLRTSAQGSTTSLCLGYDAGSQRFTGVVSGLLKGWPPGSTQELVVEVLDGGGTVVGRRSVVVVVT